MKNFVLAVLALSLSAASFASCGDIPICPGDRVITSGNLKANVMEVFSNGKIKIDYDDYTVHGFISASELAFAVKCTDNMVCVGKRVVTSGNLIGTVREAFSNGKVEIDYDDYNVHGIINASEISTRSNCVKGICVNDRVIADSNLTGRVLDVFSNGKAKVDYDDYTVHGMISIRELSKEYKCNGNLCVGDKVITTGNLTGRILAVFENGKSKIDYDDYTVHGLVKMSELGYELGECRQ
jgi:preprotein translocase subunit YajC